MYLIEKEILTFKTIENILKDWKTCLAYLIYEDTLKEQEYLLCQQLIEKKIFLEFFDDHLKYLENLKKQMLFYDVPLIDHILNDYNALESAWQHYKIYENFYLTGQSIARYYMIQYGMACINLLTDIITQESRCSVKFRCNFT